MEHLCHPAVFLKAGKISRELLVLNQHWKVEAVGVLSCGSRWQASRQEHTAFSSDPTVSRLPTDRCCLLGRRVFPQLILSGNILTDVPRGCVSLAILSHMELTIKTNHHSTGTKYDQSGMLTI